MKKTFIILCVMASWFQFNVAMENHQVQRTSPSPVRFLNRIQTLKDAHKIPRLVIKSITNHTQYNLAAVDEVTYWKYNQLRAGETIEINECILEHQNKISRDDRLNGVADQFQFIIAEVDSFGDLVFENSGECCLDLVVELDEEKGDISSQPVDYMYVRLFVSFHHIEKGYFFVDFDLDDDYDSDEIVVNIEFFESESPEYIFKAQISRYYTLADFNHDIEKFKKKLQLIDVTTQEDDEFFPLSRTIAKFESFNQLHWATYFDKTNVVELLIESGADINSRDSEGWTPLHRAAGNNSVEIAQLLIKAGANIESKDNYGWTPLQLTASSGSIDVMQLLIQMRANINSLDDSGATALFCLNVYLHSSKLAQLLINAGADPNIKSNYGHIPLHLAVTCNSMEVAQLLIDAGADLNSKNHDGKTLLESCKTEEMRKLLLQNMNQ